MAELGRGERVPVASGALYNHESWMHGFFRSTPSIQRILFISN